MNQKGKLSAGEWVMTIATILVAIILLIGLFWR